MQVLIFMSIYLLTEISPNHENIIICAEPYHCSTEQSIKFIKYFEKCGADIVSLIFGEKFYSENQILNHFKTIHNRTKIFLLLHQQLIENGLSAKTPYIFYSVKLLNNIISGTLLPFEILISLNGCKFIKKKKTILYL